MSIDLGQLKQAALAATPGPWEYKKFGDQFTLGNGKPEGQGRYCVAANIHSFADASFLVAANPAAVLELIERLERAEALPVAAEKDAERYRFAASELSIGIFDGFNDFQEWAEEDIDAAIAAMQQVKP